MKRNEIKSILSAYCCAALFFAKCFAADEISFENEIRPILAERCLGCHNNANRDGDLSIQSALEIDKSSVVIPGDAESSLLWQQVQVTDGQAEMPKDAPHLTEDELRLLREWISQGAHWPEGLELEPPRVQDFKWWSFTPILRPTPPPQPAQQELQPIDAFVSEQLRAQGLEAVTTAGRRELIRRVTYDLTGLPPTFEEVQAFINDSSTDAYENLVDRLLASERYGERWARHWLDVVKYADTCGYDKDKLRPNAWPYRDYVIRSFNEDKPYGRFIEEQIAGDILYPGQPDSVVALGFLAAGPWDFIGHVEVPESKMDGQVARNLDRDDMVSNTINTFCSITIQCARCHNHKFDPFTQEDYYGLQAVFAAVDRADRVYDESPNLSQQRAKLAEQIAATKEKLTKLRDQRIKLGGEKLVQLEARIQKLKTEIKLRKADEFGYHSALVKKPDETKWVSIHLEEPRDLKTITLHPCHDNFAGIGAGFGFPVRFTVQTSKFSEGPQWETIGKFNSASFDVESLQPIHILCNAPKTRRVRFVANTLAERKNDYMLALAEVELVDSDCNPVSRKMLRVTAKDSIEAPPRWRKSNLIDGKWPSYDDDATVAELRNAERAAATLLQDIETTTWRESLQKAENELDNLQAKLKELPAGKMVYSAATHFPTQGNFKATEGTPRSIHVLSRGDVSKPLQPVSPNALPLAQGESYVFENAETEGSRRARLAKWLSRQDNPLVWRSIVNRVWQYHFGRGLVPTPNDFGRMGGKPSHPELLDWLASEFREHQSFKQLHRQIVLSRTYQRSGQSHPENEKRDASNTYLWRMNRRRLDAEEVRDSILAVSGKLDLSMGGPGDYLFALEQTDHSPHFEYHKFDPSMAERHRRSIYRFVVRSQPDPWMSSLDCADSSQSTPRRHETLTSLQALALLNSRFNTSMAEELAARIKTQQAKTNEQIRLAFRLALQRDPTNIELDELSRYTEEHGLENASRFLFNLSEFVYLD